MMNKLTFNWGPSTYLLHIGFLYILISKGLQSFIEFCALVFELNMAFTSGLRRTWGATRPKLIYPPTASGDIISRNILHTQSPSCRKSQRFLPCYGGRGFEWPNRVYMGISLIHNVFLTHNSHVLVAPEKENRNYILVEYILHPLTQFPCPNYI